MNARLNNIGALIKCGTPTIPPQSSTGGAINGTGTDRINYLSCVVVAQTGATTGSPTTQSVAVKLQTSSDNATWSDYKPDGTNVATFTISAVNAVGELDVNLQAASRYVRVVSTVAFTGGSSPTLLTSAVLVLGGATILPA